MFRSSLKFVVTGTGRSGTGYAAAVFSAAGLQCGHEQYFGVRPALGEVGVDRDLPFSSIRTPYHKVREHRRRMQLQLEGDASWMAVPRLNAFRGFKLLQVRHPLAVVRSFAATGFFQNASRHVLQRRFALKFFTLTGDPLEDALRWWVHWNRLALQNADVVYPLESFDANLLKVLLDSMGVAEADLKAQNAVVQVNATVNSASSRGLRPPTLSWDEIPASEAKLAATDLATELGYDAARVDAVPTVGLQFIT